MRALLTIQMFCLKNIAFAGNRGKTAVSWPSPRRIWSVERVWLVIHMAIEWLTSRCRWWRWRRVERGKRCGLRVRWRDCYSSWAKIEPQRPTRAEEEPHWVELLVLDEDSVEKRFF